MTVHRIDVVGAAILGHGQKLLVARRAKPPHMSGMWEFPGGKIEPGESPIEALVRECDEELGVRITVDRRIGDEVPISAKVFLTVWTAQIIAGTPEAREHAELRWIGPDGLDTLPFLAPDRPFLAPLKAILGER